MSQKVLSVQQSEQEVTKVVSLIGNDRCCLSTVSSSLNDPSGHITFLQSHINVDAIHDIASQLMEYCLNSAYSSYILVLVRPFPAADYYLQTETSIFFL